MLYVTILPIFLEKAVDLYFLYILKDKQLVFIIVEDNRGDDFFQ